MWDIKIRTEAILVIFLINNVNAISRIDPLVDTKLGLIRGLRASDGDYSMFMGIPYATVNESNPFGFSIPYPGFKGTFEAYDDSAKCPQFEKRIKNIVGSLDCLHLNIYVPNLANSRNPLSVAVWIHGGSFATGYSGRFGYGPRYLVKQEVILVTVNYRLGPYGFMCLDDPEVPGNQGIRDQQLALRWIKNNIAAFGGDSNKITIFGQSAGGHSTDFHVTYSREKLFNQAIMHSGAILCPKALLEPDKSAPIKLAQHLGLATSDMNEALEFLAETDPADVIESTLELDIVFKPCVEKKFEGIERFIYDYPINIKKPHNGGIPIMVGYASHEMLFEYEHLQPEEYTNLNVFYDTLNYYLNLTSIELIAMEKDIRRFYIGDEAISIKVKDGLTRFASDFLYIHPIVRTINKFLDIGSKNIYHYVFFYDGDRGVGKFFENVTTAGAMHSDDLGYLFDGSYFDSPSTEDQLVIDQMTIMWANFIKYGNPTPAITEILPVQWPTVTKDQFYYLKIDSDLTVGKRNFNDRMAMWNLFYKINKQYLLGYREDDE